MTDAGIAALCAAEITAAQDNDKAEYRESRERALAYFLGDMSDTPSEDGRSRAQTSQTADVVEWIEPGLQRIFFGSDRIVEYLPVTPEDDEAAKQASDLVNYVVELDGEGKAAIKAAMHDGLVVRKGVLKAWWCVETKYKTERYSGLSDDAFTMLTADDAVTVLEHTETIDPEYGPMHDCKLRRETKQGRVKIEAVPPERLTINVGATSIAKARFVCHRDTMTRSDLLEIGYDPERVKELPRASGVSAEDDGLELARNRHLASLASETQDRSMDEIEVHECYLRVDIDGDGIAEWIRVVLAGGTGEKNVMAVEEWGDPIPFVELNPMPVPHRWVGRSIADSTMDIQQIATVLLRQTLDNIYEQNHPLMGVIENHVINPEALINRRFGGVVRFKNTPDARASIFPVVPAFVADTTFNMLSYLDELLERRTGVSRSTMALDPEALQNQTAEAVRAGKDAQYSKVELIARNYAQGGLRDLFRILLKLIVTHQDRAQAIRLRDKWVEMDPRAWNAEMDCIVSTGLGTGSRERDLAMLMQIYQTQIGLLQMATQFGGPALALELVSPVQIYNTLAKAVEASGLRDVDQYFGRVTDEDVQGALQQQQSAPDPETQKAQAKIQIDQAVAQHQAELARAKAQADLEMQRMRNESDVAAMRERASLEIQMQRDKAAAELQIKRDEAALNAQLRREEMQLEAELTAEKNRMMAKSQADTNIRGVQ
jgi:hypothetical protein